MKYTKETPVGAIVGDNYQYEAVMNRFGLDYCCNGHRSIAEASREAGVDPEEVLGL